MKEGSQLNKERKWRVGIYFHTIYSSVFQPHPVPEAPTCMGPLHHSRRIRNCLCPVCLLHPFSTVYLWLLSPSEPNLCTKKGRRTQFNTMCEKCRKDIIFKKADISSIYSFMCANVVLANVKNDTRTKELTPSESSFQPISTFHHFPFSSIVCP